ncbi:hypothetical protein J6590_060735 [Homalodisca vitripennis]|nr:hypothetical protein J6590_060735 [Homalodisca vitripennis]
MFLDQHSAISGTNDTLLKDPGWHDRTPEAEVLESVPVPCTRQTTVYSVYKYSHCI